jgi:hypothetical protein
MDKLIEERLNIIQRARDVMEFCTNIIKMHGGDTDWEIRWGRSREHICTYHATSNVFMLSRYKVLQKLENVYLYSFNEIRDSILHMVAHMRSGVTHYGIHHEKWLTECKKMRYTPTGLCSAVRHR